MIFSTMKAILNKLIWRRIEGEKGEGNEEDCLSSSLLSSASPTELYLIIIYHNSVHFPPASVRKCVNIPQ